MTTGHMSDTAVQKLVETLPTAAQHSHASRGRPTVSLAAECCEEQDGGTRILGEVQSTAAPQQASAMCCRVHEGRVELCCGCGSLYFHASMKGYLHLLLRPGVQCCGPAGLTGQLSLRCTQCSAFNVEADFAAS